ncbi:MAG TPA: N-formylglutamate amidohydrolase [Cyclobacteriaceae bacterium]
MNQSVFKLTIPEKDAVPLLISVPHCGILFPDSIKAQYKSELIAAPDDTDWFVDELYNFGPELGATMIAANYNRWVVDLNRDPQSKPLYTDGRIITALCPATDFLGNPIYKDSRKEVSDSDVQQRVNLYYKPYHEEIVKQLDRLKNKFGKVLLWDCHSIRQIVPTVQRDKFPDLILGDADETSASIDLINSTLTNLRSFFYSVNHNHPFKGGYITRQYGKPKDNQHALQLEMSKVNYMDDTETKFDITRANKMRELLRKTLSELIIKLK